MGIHAADAVACCGGLFCDVLRHAVWLASCLLSSVATTLHVGEIFMTMLFGSLVRCN
jgi:hypothetical protein